MSRLINLSPNILANPTFSTPMRKYHQIIRLSLLCSEWKEVVHLTMNHQDIKAQTFLTS